MTAGIAILGEDERVLVGQHIEWRYVTETTTGLIFSDDTPIEVWGALTERLIRQQKRIEWAIGDALQFGERRYGDTYAQWVEQTGLAENTLATIKWVAGAIERSRRREDVGWAYHREVASLPIPEQEKALDAAETAGMTRYELRQEVRKRQDRLAGQAVDAAGTPLTDAESLWVPGLEDLTEEARAALEAHAPGGRHRTGYVAGFCAALVWAEQRDAFLPGKWRGL